MPLIKFPAGAPPFSFETALRPEDIEFIVIDQLPEPGFWGSSRPYGDYYGEADDTCFIIRSVYRRNRLRAPIAEGRMEKTKTGGTLVTVEFKPHWSHWLTLLMFCYYVLYSLYHLLTKPFSGQALGAAMGAFFFFSVVFLIFLFYIRSDCKKMKAMMLDIFKGSETTV